METYKLLFVLLLCVLNVNPNFAQDMPEKTGVYLYKTHTKGNQTLNYRMLYPLDFDENKVYPLVVFLHGKGERGSDNEAHLIHGSKLFLDSLEKYPAIVVFPQCPAEDFWANLNRPEAGKKVRNLTFHTDKGPTPALALVMDLMDTLIEKDYIDNDRVYVTGLSMGGMGTFELLWRMPEKIAAALPICGGGPREKAAAMIHVPIWIFHGVKDDVVYPDNSIVMLNAIQTAGGKAKISLYEEADHNSWNTAFAEPAFLSWMFSKKRKSLK